MRPLRRVLNPLLGRNLNSSSFKRLVQSAFSRLETLKKYRHERCIGDRREVVELLDVGLPKRALSPYCEQIIKHQNLLDVYGMIEGYLNLIKERIYLLRHGRECPEELKEAVSSVVFAASRCKDLPELEEIKSILTSRFGREFASRAVELHNNNAVNDLIKQKLSTKKPDMGSKINLLKVIASENDFTLQLDEKGELSSCTKIRQQKRKQSRGVALTNSPYRTRSSSRIRRR